VSDEEVEELAAELEQLDDDELAAVEEVAAEEGVTLAQEGPKGPRGEAPEEDLSEGDEDTEDEWDVAEKRLGQLGELFEVLDVDPVDAFVAADEDGDGEISPEEGTKALKKLAKGLREELGDVECEEVQEFLDEVDAEVDEITPDVLKAELGVLDEDGSGALSLEEFGLLDDEDVELDEDEEELLEHVDEWLEEDGEDFEEDWDLEDVDDWEIEEEDLEWLDELLGEDEWAILDDAELSLDDLVGLTMGDLDELLWDVEDLDDLEVDEEALL